MLFALDFCEIPPQQAHPPWGPFSVSREEKTTSALQSKLVCARPLLPGSAGELLTPQAVLESL